MGDPPSNIRSDGKDLIDYPNRVNADWVMVSKRISPAVLTDLLEVICTAAGSAYMANPRSNGKGCVFCRMGRRSSIGQLVPYSPRMHGEMASPAADTGSRE